MAFSVLRWDFFFKSSFLNIFHICVKLACKWQQLDIWRKINQGLGKLFKKWVSYRCYFLSSPYSNIFVQIFNDLELHMLRTTALNHWYPIRFSFRRSRDYSHFITLRSSSLSSSEYRNTQVSVPCCRKTRLFRSAITKLSFFIHN